MLSLLHRFFFFSSHQEAQLQHEAHGQVERVKSAYEQQQEQQRLEAQRAAERRQIQMHQEALQVQRDRVQKEREQRLKQEQEREQQQNREADRREQLLREEHQRSDCKSGLESNQVHKEFAQILKNMPSYLNSEVSSDTDGFKCSGFRISTLGFLFLCQHKGVQFQFHLSFSIH